MSPQLEKEPRSLAQAAAFLLERAVRHRMEALLSPEEWRRRDFLERAERDLSSVRALLS